MAIRPKTSLPSRSRDRQQKPRSVLPFMLSEYTAPGASRSRHASQSDDESRHAPTFLPESNRSAAAAPAARGWPAAACLAASTAGAATAARRRRSDPRPPCTRGIGTTATEGSTTDRSVGNVPVSRVMVGVPDTTDVASTAVHVASQPSFCRSVQRVTRINVISIVSPGAPRGR